MLVVHSRPPAFFGLEYNAARTPNARVLSRNALARFDLVKVRVDNKLSQQFDVFIIHKIGAFLKEKVLDINNI